MKKKRKQPTRKSLTHKADDLFSRYWREKIEKCEKCGRKESLQVAHIISRDCRKLRYDRDNTFVLCYSCHFTFHRKPLEFAEFVKQKKGEDMYKYLLKASNIVKPLSIDYYEKIIKYYQDKTV